MSQREAARVFNVSRDTVRKMMSFSVPPGYRRTIEVRRPKLDPFVPIIEGWLEADRSMPRKQRHTAKRVFDRLREECGFTGGYTIIKDYIRERERRGQEVFVPLSHPPGHAQADFGEALVRIGCVEQKAHFFVLDLPHSDGCYVRAYPVAVAEAWVDGHIHERAGIMVIGDDDQDILRWQRKSGASRLSEFAEAYFDRFENDFGGEAFQSLELRVNFRSGAEIVEMSQRMISGFFDRSTRSQRLKKTLLRQSSSACKSQCERIDARNWNWGDTVNQIADTCLRLHTDNPGSTAVLCRTNDEVAELHRIWLFTSQISPYRAVKTCGSLTFGMLPFGATSSRSRWQRGIAP